MQKFLVMVLLVCGCRSTDDRPPPVQARSGSKPKPASANPKPPESPAIREEIVAAHAFLAAVKAKDAAALVAASCPKLDVGGTYADSTSMKACKKSVSLTAASAVETVARCLFLDNIAANIPASPGAYCLPSYQSDPACHAQPTAWTYANAKQLRDDTASGLPGAKQNLKHLLKVQQTQQIVSIVVGNPAADGLTSVRFAIQNVEGARKVCAVFADAMIEDVE